MGGDLAFVGDVHLDHGDPQLEPFLAWLDRLSASCADIVFIGDLFNLWLGDRRLEGAHQTAVVERLIALRRAGVAVRYIEGNRDYRIAAAYAGVAFDEVASEGLVCERGGTRVWAAHGDLANTTDRQYRLWRRVSRWGPAWRLFQLVPAGYRLWLAESIETRMRATNLEHKEHFPDAMVRRYAAPALASGHALVALGHFHVERDLDTGGGRIVVLPLWRDTRRFLRVRADGGAAIETAVV